MLVIVINLTRAGRYPAQAFTKLRFDSWAQCARMVNALDALLRFYRPARNHIPNGIHIDRECS